MKKHFDVIVVIPVGPHTNVDFINDTIDSYQFYSVAHSRIVLVDDSHQGLGELTRQTHPDIDVVCTRKSAGAMAGLYLTLSLAFRFALDHYDFELLFKLDTDALIIGPAPEQTALQKFRKNEDLAIAGQYPLDYQGNLWDMGWPRSRILNGTMTWRYVRRPIANILLRKLYLRALRNNYRTGESVFGGAYFMSKIFLDRLQTAGLLPEKILGRLNMGEDHIFSLLAKSLGMELGSLSGPGQPFGCAWKGLPASPAQLLQDGKKIIHSTRQWGEMNEQDIRSFYRARRVKQESGEILQHEN